MSDKGFEIPLTVPGVKEALAAFDAVADKMREAGRASASARSAANSARSDPWAREAAAKDSYSRMSGMGLHDDDLRASRLEMVRASRAVQRANRDLNPQAADLMKQMLYRTRLKVGPFMPLIGDLVKNDLLDPKAIDSVLSRIGGLAGAKTALKSIVTGAFPFLLGAGAVAAVAGGAYELMNAGSASSRRIGNAFYSAGGGNGTSTGQNLGLAGFMGTDAAGMAGMATNLGERLRGGGYGASIMRQGGVIDLGRFTIDKFANLTKAIDLLRGMEEKKAIMVARDLGIESLLYTRDISSTTLGALRRSGGQMTPEERKSNAEYDANRARLGNDIDNGYRAVANPVIRSTNFLMDFLGGISGNAESMTNLIYRFGWKTRGEAAIEAGKGGKTSDLVDALGNLTRTIKDHQEFIGGGTRARGAMPAGQKGGQLEESLRSQAQIYGAFTIA
jgi:hypothetical protein